MSISLDDFTTACHTLQQTWQHLQQDSEWSDVRVLEKYGIVHLRITKSITNHHPAASSTHLEEEPDLHEEDEETLPISKINNDSITIIYEIIHSPTYQVPVLYITTNLHSTSSTPTVQPKTLPSPEEIYNLLVPSPQKAQLRHIGSMGALSMTDHPITSLPVYFIHPCRTSEAMASVSCGNGTKPLEYLIMWLGLVGGSVGLNVPFELARSLSGS